MEKSRLKEIKKKFFTLNEREQSALLSEIYRFSKETKVFLENRLLGADVKVYLDELEKLTYDRFAVIPPKWIDARKVNAIISSAKKAKVGQEQLMEIQIYVFKAYVSWIDMYGISDEAIEEKCAMHLEKSLSLLLDIYDMSKDKKHDIKDELLDIIDAHSNIYRDHLYEMVEMVKFSKN